MIFDTGKEKQKQVRDRPKEEVVLIKEKKPIW